MNRTILVLLLLRAEMRSADHKSRQGAADAVMNTPGKVDAMR
jgi:hypothetical protein